MKPADDHHTGLQAVTSCTTVLLILGSFPGQASLDAQAYYAHPRNQFWPIMQAILAPAAGMDLGCSYENRSKWLLGHGLGLWDVYAACERQGSLDAAIRNARLNDFATLRQRCPALRAVAFNGAQAWRHAPHVLAALNTPDLPPVAAYPLPSTSPANASWSFERKRAAWQAVVGEVMDAK